MPVNPKEAPRGYLAKAEETCVGCCFKEADCTDLGAPCSNQCRKDKTDVIFVSKDALWLIANRYLFLTDQGRRKINKIAKALNGGIKPCL